jgi:hypothetical protein
MQKLTREQLLDLLDDISAAAENMLLHYGSTMPEEDAAARGQLILKARDVCNAELRGEDDDRS